MPYSPTIYKYRTWSKSFHRDTLLKNHLFFASPSEINDPFDFKITVDYRLLDTIVKREQYIDSLISQTLPELIQRGIDIVAKKKELIWRIEHDTVKMQEEFDNTSSVMTDKRFGVISFSQRWDSILMWSHYSENHKGFCIGYNRNKIEDSDIFGSLGGVNYTEQYPSIDPNNTDIAKELIVKTHTKSLEWKYEEEFRATQLWDDADPTVEERIVKVPQDFIEEIILGMFISDSHKAEINKIAKDRNIPVFIIRQKSRAFLLEKELLP